MNYDRILQENKRATLALAIAFGALLILSSYLLQRDLTSIAEYTGDLIWSGYYQISILGLLFSYTTMTLLWPVVIAAICIACRMFAAREMATTALLIQELPESSRFIQASSSTFHIGVELAHPFARLSWSAITLMPVGALIVHLSAGLLCMARLIRSTADVTELDGYFKFWPPEWAIAAIVFLSLASAFAIWVACSTHQTLGVLSRELARLAFLASRADDRADRETDVSAAPGSWELFISAKRLTAAGSTTRDHILAEQLYERFVSNGIRTFLSSSSLAIVGASAFKQVIDEALEQCSILVVVATAAAHLKSTWVKYEWDSFLNEILSDHKPNGRLFVYLDGENIRNIPLPLRQCETFEHGRDGEERLLVFVRNALNAVSKAAPPVQ